MHVPCVLGDSFVLSLGNGVFVLRGTLFRSRPPSSSPPPSPNQSPPPPPPPLGFDPEDKNTVTSKDEANDVERRGSFLEVIRKLQYTSKVKCVTRNSRRTDFLEDI